MTVTPQTARKIIKAGQGEVIGACSTDRWPEGEQYWIINDNARMRVLHVRFADAPRLGSADLLK